MVDSCGGPHELLVAAARHLTPNVQGHLACFDKRKMELRPDLQKIPEWFWFAALFAVVLLSRLPFVGVEYGREFDAWRVARAAQHIAETGEYETSRAPGYPVQEIVCSLIWRGGPRALDFGLLTLDS